MKANIPGVKIYLGDRDLTDKLWPFLMSLTITEKMGEDADQLDLVLDDSRQMLPLPKEGEILKVSIGWRQGGDGGGMVDKGAFRIDEVEHSGPPDQIVIKARSADFTSDLAVRREKTWHDTTIGAVVRDIAGRNALRAACAPALASIAVKTLVQSRESDMALMRRLGREHDAIAAIKAGALIFMPIGATTTPAGTPIAHLELRRSDGDRHSFRIAKREEAKGVTATYHDRKAGKAKRVTEGETKGSRRLSRTYATEGQARHAARSAKKRSDRAPVTMDYALALGRAGLSPGQKVSLAGFRPEISEVQWLVSEVTHSVSDRGFVTQTKLERASG